MSVRSQTCTTDTRNTLNQFHVQGQVLTRQTGAKIAGKSDGHPSAIPNLNCFCCISCVRCRIFDGLQMFEKSTLFSSKISGCSRCFGIFARRVPRSTNRALSACRGMYDKHSLQKNTGKRDGCCDFWIARTEIAEHEH